MGFKIIILFLFVCVCVCSLSAFCGNTGSDVLAFCSGADRIPPLGFGKVPKIVFLRQGILATASTCDIVLRLPTVHTTYESFKDAFIMSLKCNDGFGGV